MNVQSGDKVHIIVRRAFEGDLRRHFAGEVVDVGENSIRVEGYAFVMETGTQYERRTGLRTRIFSLTDANIILNVLPPATKLQKLSYGPSKEGRLCVSDGGQCSLDINEFGYMV